VDRADEPIEQGVVRVERSAQAGSAPAGSMKAGSTPAGSTQAGSAPAGSTQAAVSVFEQVGHFHAAVGVGSPDGPTLAVAPRQLALRQDLLDEEVAELRAAVAAGDLVAVADALADIVYVACGTAHVLGIPFDEVFAEVHRANMSKLDADGKPVLRADGKVLKGPSYVPPDVAGALARARRGPPAGG